MRPIRRITAKESNDRFVTQRSGDPFVVRRCDPVEPEPVGTIIVMAFRITGYDPDCDGSLMARLEHIDRSGNATGWEPTHLGLYPDCDLVVELGELRDLFQEKERE